MAAPVSVIIPTLNVAERIMPGLLALTEAALDGLIAELILVDAGSNDEIEPLANAFGARLMQTPAGRGIQMHAGAEASRGEWLLFLHADSVPEGAWIDAVRLHTAGPTDRAGYFDLRFRSGAPMARVVARWANLRARVFALPYGDQGLLIHRSLYRKLGGYPPIQLMEDVAIARQLGRRLQRIGATLTTSAERYERNGWIRQGAGNLLTLARYRAGADPAELARRYDRTR